MKKIEMFDPVMCCPTGVCGPSVDPELIRISAAVQNLKHKGIDIVRYNLGSEPDAFVANETISTLLAEKGPGVLPVVLADGEIITESSYPTNAELASLTGTAEEELGQKPKVRLSLQVKK